MSLKIVFSKELELFGKSVFELFSFEVITEAASSTIDPLFIKMYGILVLDILPPRENVA